MIITANDRILGARIEDIDLRRPFNDNDFRTILRALGKYGVLCFPAQSLEPKELSVFGAYFGELEINVANKYHPPGHPEVMILSNIMIDGKQIGLVDAGQLWHTDVSYASEIAFANVLHAKAVPTRDGRPLGDTQFRNMYAAYDDLPADVKQRLAGVNAVHDFCVFWERMLQRPETKRQPLTEEQRQMRPPVEHPIFMKHPITGRHALYCNPGFATRIVGMEPTESDEMLEFLFEHQSKDKYFYAHQWSVGDVLIWDNICTTHNAAADYGPDEGRLMHRVQVMATRDYAKLAA
jgi:alpha-ketoglutarate-dependent taurine dioxygenase